MRTALLIPVAGLALALATPAFAQSASTNGSASAKGSTKSGSAATMPHAGLQAMSQDKLRKQLEAAGFKNVKVLDAAYLVQAQTQDGNMVYMTINPPEALSGSSSSSDTSGSGSGSGSGTGSSMGNAPSGGSSSGNPTSSGSPSSGGNAGSSNQ